MKKKLCIFTFLIGNSYTCFFRFQVLTMSNISVNKVRIAKHSEFFLVIPHDPTPEQWGSKH